MMVRVMAVGKGRSLQLLIKALKEEGREVEAFEDLESAGKALTEACLPGNQPFDVVISDEGFRTGIDGITFLVNRPEGSMAILCTPEVFVASTGSGDTIYMQTESAEYGVDPIIQAIEDFI